MIEFTGFDVITLTLLTPLIAESSCWLLKYLHPDRSFSNRLFSQQIILETKHLNMLWKVLDVYLCPSGSPFR